MEHLFLSDVCLDLFDAGTAGVAAAPAAAESAADAGAQAGSQAAAPGRSRRGESTGGAQRVVYGKHPAAAQAAEEAPDAGVQKEKAEEKPAAESPEQRKVRFRSLVDGEFKDLFTEETQRIIDRRFRETKTLEEALEAQKPILEVLAERYQVPDGDPERLMRAIEQDTAYWSDAAEQAGMSVEQYQKFRRLQRENEALLRAQKEAQGRQAAQQVKRVYADFELEAECKNPQFLSMLRSGVPMQHAYEVIHLDAIKGGVAQQAAQNAERAVVENIKAKGARPVENGVSSQNAITVKSDVSKLSRKDREEIARRVARGEEIVF